MKADIHPDYAEVTVTCVCGNSFQTRSTMGKDFHVEICSECHPFFTGKQKLVDTAGRVDRFRKKFGDQYTSGKEGRKKRKLRNPDPGKMPKAEAKEDKPRAEKPKAEAQAKKADDAASS